MDACTLNPLPGSGRPAPLRVVRRFLAGPGRAELRQDHGSWREVVPYSCGWPPCHCTHRGSSSMSPASGRPARRRNSTTSSSLRARPAVRARIVTRRPPVPAARCTTIGAPLRSSGAGASRLTALAALCRVGSTGKPWCRRPAVHVALGLWSSSMVSFRPCRSGLCGRRRRAPRHPCAGQGASTRVPTGAGCVQRGRLRLHVPPARRGCDRFAQWVRLPLAHDAQTIRTREVFGHIFDSRWWRAAARTSCPSCNRSLSRPCGWAVSGPPKGRRRRLMATDGDPARPPPPPLLNG